MSNLVLFYQTTQNSKGCAQRPVLPKAGHFIFFSPVPITFKTLNLAVFCNA
jgi:hypothetical protein